MWNLLSGSSVSEVQHYKYMHAFWEHDYHYHRAFQKMMETVCKLKIQILPYNKPNQSRLDSDTENQPEIEHLQDEPNKALRHFFVKISDDTCK